MSLRNTEYSRRVVLAVVPGLLCIPWASGCRRSEAGAKATAHMASADPNLPNNMTGTWVHVGHPGQVSKIAAGGLRLKFRTGKYWTLTHADPSGLVVEHFGGTYTLTNNEYAETQDYGDDRCLSDNGKTFRYVVKVEGDTMTQIGIDNRYSEVWKRAK